MTANHTHDRTTRRTDKRANAAVIRRWGNLQQNDRIRKDAERLLTTHDLTETIWILSARTGKSADVIWLIIETVV